MPKPDHQLRVYETVGDLIASPENPTPMVRLNERFNPNSEFVIYLKLDFVYFNKKE